ncbi:hypothetical protein E3N88_28270 [Mikania micrantha]|uniref:non-specific serine/threonine protein kinase n=1 Tax=Mikania micrantha TaxID=192012 RepID=A0A5N6MZ01_9ASTR|nr:hypothetical protein E3N88_28270 [Mikania micrantha]
MGKLPGDIGQFTELRVLDLSYNKDLTGSLTPQIGNLKNLKKLSLIGCGFTGAIPAAIGNLENLFSLSLNSNGFTGPIPASIGYLSKLRWLDLTDNKLTGSIPVSNEITPTGLDKLTKAEHFHLSDNELSGDIPLGLFKSNMTLIHVLLQNNKLTGAIPSSLGLVTSLQVVQLDRNSFSGNVPSNINRLINLTQMSLANNQLTGPIPNLTDMNLLNYIDLSNNIFDQSDAIPPWFSSLQALRIIKMHKTNLEGELPVALFSIPRLQIVDLSNNWITRTLNIGSYPSTQLQLVDLRNNQITDFDQRSQYNNSIGLRLAGNPICGESGVVDEFCSITKDTGTSYSTPCNNCVTSSCDSSLILSPNCQCAYPYRGSIIFKYPSFSSLTNPTIFMSLHDSLMEFFHKASFPVDSVALKNPTRNVDDYLVVNLEIFPSRAQSFNTTEILWITFAFVNYTFTPPEVFNYIYYFIPNPYETGNNKDKASNTGIIIGSTVGGCVVMVLLVLAGFYTFYWKEKAKRAPQQSHSFELWDPSDTCGDVPQLKGARFFTFEELHRYTNNFSEFNNIGKGGYGMVYKGSLPNGKLVAIKRARKGSSQGGLEFKTEIELLSRVHHKNVVNLIGFCFDQGEQMLVYEYIVNGTLKDSLSGRSGIWLDWTRRLKIALGAARGLQYLHDHADPPIIHRDVKTNNILLDERLDAKVADFGLSRPLSGANTTHITTEVKGTMGYMDPEYYLTQQLTEKSDTYSFGVVMLELITARNPIDNGKYIVKEVKESMNKNKELYDLQKVLDPTIGLTSPLKGFERFIDLACRCVEETQIQRPTMSEVVKELESIMELAGINRMESSSSTSASYERGSKDYSSPYDSDSLLSYSLGSLPTKLHPKNLQKAGQAERDEGVEEQAGCLWSDRLPQ